MGLGKMADGNGFGHVGSVLSAAFGGGVAQGGIGRLFVGSLAGSANVGGGVEYRPFLCGAAVAAATVLGVLYAAAARQMAWLRTLMFLPFMVSPVCIAFGVLLLYPQWTASLWLLTATYALLAYPFVAKDVLAAWDGLPKDYAAAARTMGANGFQTACYVTAPLLKPALRRGLTLASATCIGEFAATLFLSRPEWQTLTTLIYDYLGRAGADNYGRAMVLTAVLTALALTAFLLVDEAEGQKAV